MCCPHEDGPQSLGFDALADEADSVNEKADAHAATQPAEGGSAGERPGWQAVVCDAADGEHGCKEDGCDA